MVNALVEESLFRGVLFTTLKESSNSVRIALIGQALAFGAAHYYGFPRGWTGVALASVYGLMTGALRIRSGGLLAPWVTHVVTDVTIIGILIVSLD
jgi:membrane protease YdiL (CAAX protease family)